MVAMFASPPNLYVEILTAKMIVLASGAFGKWLGLEGSWLGLMPLEKKLQRVFSLPPPARSAVCEQELGPQQPPDVPAWWSCTSQPPEL